MAEKSTEKMKNRLGTTTKTAKRVPLPSRVRATFLSFKAENCISNEKPERPKAHLFSVGCALLFFSLSAFACEDHLQKGVRNWLDSENVYRITFEPGLVDDLREIYTLAHKISYINFETGYAIGTFSERERVELIQKTKTVMVKKRKGL